MLLLKPLCVTQEDVLYCCTGPLKRNGVSHSESLFSVSIIVPRLRFVFLKDTKRKQAHTNTDSLKKKCAFVF